MPTTNNWQLINPMHADIFDCDGTLSSIEGIDELARQNHVFEQVEALTAKAMGQTGMHPELYSERLQLTQPTKQHVLDLAENYRRHIVPEADSVITLLQKLNKKIFIVSAGLKPAVSLFAKTFNIPASHVFAVDILFDDKGKYLDFDHSSPMTYRDGKREIARELMREYQTVAHIGDGLNDFIVHDLVTRFIGYGGVYYRKQIEAECDFYISQKSLAGCLPLLLNQTEAALLQHDDRQLFDRGLAELGIAS